MNERTFSTPTYFPAISSYGIKFPLHDLLYFLKFHKYPRVLVSAYDLYYMRGNERTNALSLIRDYRKTGFVFLDSGLFESSWKNDKEWDLSPYKNILSQVEFDLYSSFDVYRDDRKSYEEFKKNTYDNILESSVFLDNVIFYSVLHETSPDRLLRLVKDFTESHSSTSNNIAVAERDIGKSIQERAETILAIRRILNRNDCRNLLHLLGCGNPLSMLLYSYCGADTFDSLDWLKFVVNVDDYAMSDFSHLELLGCRCYVCTSSLYVNADYFEKVLLHNLLFYQNFVVQLQSLIRNDNLKAYVHKHIGDKIIKQIEEY